MIASRYRESTPEDNNKSPAIYLRICDSVQPTLVSEISDQLQGAFYEREFEPLLLPDALIESG